MILSVISLFVITTTGKTLNYIHTKPIFIDRVETGGVYKNYELITKKDVAFTFFKDKFQKKND